MEISNIPYHIGNLKPSVLFTDSSYQREVRQDVVKKIVKHWNEKLVNPPKVSLRPDGSYFIFDGQHTVAAWMAVHGNEPISCRIYTGLTREEEKDLFVLQNGVVSSVSNVAKLRAEYNLGNPDVNDMVKAASLLGLTVVFGTNASGNYIINCVDCLNTIYKKLGRDNYINVLTVVRNTWEGERDSLCRGIFGGVAFIYENYADKITNAKMIEALKRHTPDYYLREAKDLTGPLNRRVAKVMIKSYNFMKRTGRLPEF